MAMRSQVWKWDNQQIVSGTPQLTGIAAGTQDSIFIGQFGTGGNFVRSITKPAETTATQFVVIEDIACTPGVGLATDTVRNGDGVVQIRINTTDYFVRPDGLPEQGVPGVASPYPRQMNFYKFFDLYPDVYILPGQVWDILYMPRVDIAPVGEATDQLVEAFVKYTLYDGPDALIANKLLEMGITVNPNNIDWYKRTLIEQQAAAAGTPPPGAAAPSGGE